MKVLHRLNESALDVARIGGLDSGINETLTTCLRVEEELRRHQTPHEAVLNESTALQTVIELGEVGKRTLLKRVLNATTLNELLTQESHHLLYVETTALGTGLNHLHNTVLLGKLRVHVLRDLIGHRLHKRVDLVLELLAIRATRVVTELACVHALQELVDLGTRIRNRLIDELVGLLICHQVSRTD